MNRQLTQKLTDAGAALDTNLTADDIDTETELIHNTRNGVERVTVTEIDERAGFGGTTMVLHLDDGSTVDEDEFYDGDRGNVPVALYPIAVEDL